MKLLFKIVLANIGRIGVLKYIIVGIISGLSSFLFINTVTRGMGLVIAGKYTTISREYVLLFAAIVLTFVWARRTLAMIIIKLGQKIGWNLRKQIIALVLNASSQQLLKRKEKVQSAVVNDVGGLTNGSMAIIDFFINLITGLACMAYMASISLTLFGMTLLMTVIGITVYLGSMKKNMAGLEKARTVENKFQKHLADILDGFREIYMEPKKGQFINEKRIGVIAEGSYKNNTLAMVGLINNQIVGNILYYIVITSILLVFSVLLPIKPELIVSYVFTMIYFHGSVETVTVLLPTIFRAGIAADQLTKLKQELEGEGATNNSTGRYNFRDGFYEIKATDIEFCYEAEKGGQAFKIGPINMTIEKGETVFIYGGNGSGKTTFVQSLLGVCIPSAGTIRVNGVELNEDSYADYRTLFAVVFSDFYLFDELLGVENFDREKWDYYINLFEIQDKVTIDEHKVFSTIDLSTGQKKRLALVCALLEEKPILVMDEWAADQDPYFRKKFYTEILPMLKESGYTIIAITHDDKYYNCADRLYKMDEGKLQEELVTTHVMGHIAESTNMLSR